MTGSRRPSHARRLLAGGAVALALLGSFALVAQGRVARAADAWHGQVLDRLPELRSGLESLVLEAWREHGGDPERAGLPSSARAALLAGLEGEEVPSASPWPEVSREREHRFRVDLELPPLEGGEGPEPVVARVLDLHLVVRWRGSGLSIHREARMDGAGAWADAAVAEALRRELALPDASL